MTDVLFGHQVAEDIGWYFACIDTQRKNDCTFSLHGLLSDLLLRGIGPTSGDDS